MNVRYDLAEGGYRQPANYRGSDLVLWHVCDIRRNCWGVRIDFRSGP